MEIEKKNEITTVYTGMNFPDDLEEDYKYIAIGEFEEQEDGTWKKVEEYDLEIKETLLQM